MKFLTLLFPPALAAASFFSSSVTEDPVLPVPGENPLTFCEDPVEAGHILLVEKVDLDPNPPQAGQNLNIKATGNFTKEILDGAYVKIEVKLGRFVILRRTEDLCSQMKEVDKECPLKEGETTVTKDVELPSYIPPGKIGVLAEVFSVDDEKITCLKAALQFRTGGAAAIEEKKQAALQEGIDL